MSDQQIPPTKVEESPKTEAATAADELQSRQSGIGSEAETSVWSGGYSPKAMIGTWVFGAVITVAAVVVAAIYLSNYFLWIMLAILVMWGLVGVMYAYRRLGFQYELTTQRFIHQTGLLSRRTDRIEVIDIDDVSVKQGPVQRIFGIGSVVIESSDKSHPMLEMIGIADAKNVAGLIDDTRRKERRKRSLHIEAI